MPRIKSKIINHKSKIRRAATLVELMISMAVMVVVFAAVVPLLRGITNSWDTRQGSVDLVQNGRILIDHLYKHLAAAKKITAVSGSSVTSGYIQFQGNDDQTYRYDISGSQYVEYGEVGSLADLAGPVSSLKFACYADDDLATPITDGNDIRLIKIQTTMTNAAPMGKNETWTTSVQLRCDVGQDQALVGWWRFDEASGLTALDSSTYGNNGTLTNMTGSRTAGVLNKGVDFDGSNDHVVLPIGSLIGSMDSITVATWANFSNTSSNWQRIFDFGTNTNVNMFLTPRNGSTGVLRFAITIQGYTHESRLNASAALPTGWHHVAVTIDGSTMTMKLYQDGVVKDTETTAVLPSDLGTTTNNYLGKSQYSPDDYYEGELDDFRIYNYVLTTAQIRDLFAVGDMVQHLPFDETSGTTAYDNAGSNNGTLVNGPTWTTGTWGGALSFDGNNDYVSAARTIQSDFTLAFWVKTSRYTHGGTDWAAGDGLVDAEVASSNRDFGTAVCDDRVAFGVGSSSGNITIRSTSSVTDNQWHHVVATRTHTSGLIQLFFDGVLQDSDTGPISSRNSPNGIRIGGSLPGTAGEYFQGRIDDVRIYDRVLTADQIALLLE